MDEPRRGPSRSDKALAAGAFVAVVIVTGIAVVYSQSPYGLTMFLTTPLVASVVSSITLHRLYPKTKFADAMSASGLGLLASSLLLLVFGLEGVMCIGMALPLLVLEIAVGSGIGNAIGGWLGGRGKALGLALPILAVIPASHFVESRYGLAPFEDLVHTRLIVNARPQQIWPHLMSLDLEPPGELLFQLGIAHPIATRTEGTRRECILSTGSMPEEITTFEPPHRLTFRVLSTPPTMRELNPFAEVHAPHLSGYYECIEGGFKLTPLDDGTTLIEGTSRYRCRIAPAAYWRLWTRKIVCDIHLRVLGEVKRRSETTNRG